MDECHNTGTNESASIEPSYTELKEAIKQAYQIIKVLNMNASDNGESWDKANFWLRDNQQFNQ